MDKPFSFPPLPTPLPWSCAVVGKMGSSGEEAGAVMEWGGFLLLSGVACAPRPRVIVEKVLKGVKALVVRELAETPGIELGFGLETDTECTGFSDFLLLDVCSPI